MLQLSYSSVVGCQLGRIQYGERQRPEGSYRDLLDARVADATRTVDARVADATRTEMRGSLTLPVP